LKKGGLRARRHSAEQENLGNQTRNQEWRKGVVAMGKDVFSKLKSICPAALVTIGWAAFVLGLILNPIGLKFMLLSAARVLPEALL